MNIFDQYGIKEVADVTLYSIHKKTDGSGDVYYVPALYLDTLKVSTVEKTGESTWATGGLGNARLINWDYGKTINVTLEDALCTPASLGMCWGGTLSADWKDAEINYQTDVCVCKNPVTRISRMEKAIYPRNDRKNSIISKLLPQVKDDTETIDNFDLLRISSVVDGTKITGHGLVGGHTYGWKMAIESAVKSIAVVPDRFFDVNGKSYSIDQSRKISADSLPDYENYKDAVIYRINTTNRYKFPPIAQIIFDNEMQNKRGKEQLLPFTVGENDNSKTNIEFLRNKKALWEGNFFITEGDESPVLYTDNNYPLPDSGYQVNIILNPNDNITNTINGKVAGIKVFTLNEYGYKKYMDDVIPSKVTEDAEGSLVSYLQNHATTTLFEKNSITQSNLIDNPIDDPQIIDKYNSINNIGNKDNKDIKDGNYLAIVVDNNDNYYALIGMVEKSNSSNNTDSNTDTEIGYLGQWEIDEIKMVEDGKTYNLDFDFDFDNDENGDLIDKENPDDRYNSGWKPGIKKLTLKAGTKYCSSRSDDTIYNNDTYTVEESNITLNNVEGVFAYDNSNQKLTHKVIVQGDQTAGTKTQTYTYTYKFISKNPSGETTSEDDFAQSKVNWYLPKTAVDVSQFKNIDMWLRFNSINEMIYFLITKYENDIEEIIPVIITQKDKTHNYDVNYNSTEVNARETLEDVKKEGKLWAYVNPRTMKPYEDDYWFHSGEPFYVKSLTLAPEGKKLKAQQIIVRADEWPGMYMMVGETYIRNRDTGKDERVQIKFPQAKVKADQTLTLQADGDPTTFTLNLEIAKPRNGHMMELTAYEIAPKMIEGDNGCFYAADGSSEVVIE